MKVTSSHSQEAQKAEKKASHADLAEEARRQPERALTDKQGKKEQLDSAQKDEARFANLLEPSAKLQKTKEKQGDSDEEQGEDQKKENRKTDREKLGSSEKILHENLEKNEKQGSFGGQSGFGTSEGVSQPALNDKFAARSILHVADLERMVSTIRMQSQLNGQREIVVQLKNSVLKGLQVKILTDGDAQVKIEFLAADEGVRAQIEEHSKELSGIIRGRGIDLGEIKTSIGFNMNRDNDSAQDETEEVASASVVSGESSSADDNTFTGQENVVSEKIYNN